MQKIPLTLITVLVPLLLKQLDTLVALAAKIAANALALAASKKVKCNDPRVARLKKNLETLAKQLAAINKALNGLTKILAALSTVGKVAQAIKLIGLLIPAFPGVPTGPTTTVITKFADTGINCVSAVSSLGNLVSFIQVELQKISAIVANALNVIGGICSNEYFDTDSNTKKQMSSLSNLNLGNKVKLSSVNANITGNSAEIGNYRANEALDGGAGNGDGNGGDGNGGDGNGGDGNGGAIGNRTVRYKRDSYGIYIDNGNFNRTYVSEFYNEYNVSDNDINNALNVLNDLYEQQKIAIRNILSDQTNLFLRDTLLTNKLNNPDAEILDQRTLMLYQEYPSDVYVGKSITTSTDTRLQPSLTGNSNDIFIGGKIDDFFIDTENKLIYGPKESDTYWGEPIKY